MVDATLIAAPSSTKNASGERDPEMKQSKKDKRLLQRLHSNVVVVALANKMARTAWAVLAKGMAFDRSRWNPLEAEAA